MSGQLRADGRWRRATWQHHSTCEREVYARETLIVCDSDLSAEAASRLSGDQRQSVALLRRRPLPSRRVRMTGSYTQDIMPC